MVIKRLCLVALGLLYGTQYACARMPRAPPGRGDHSHAFPRAGRYAQVIQSIEFNGITVLHEDLLHSMSPVQEKLDVTKHGIRVALRFQLDDMMVHPMANKAAKATPQSHGAIRVVHNETHAELLTMPLRMDAKSRSELRGELTFAPETRRSLKKGCANSTCVVHVSVNNRFLGRATVIELGKLVFFKKQSNGKTGIKLHTYPKLVESNANGASQWGGYGLTASAIFHFLLVLGAGVRFRFLLELISLG